MSDKSNAARELLDFLKTVEVDKRSSGCTHTSMDPSRKYYIGNDNLGTFYTLYENAIEAGCKFSIAEYPGLCTSLRIDFDFRHAADVVDGESQVERKYTAEQIENTIRIYQDIIREIVDEDVFEERMLVCLVFEKDDVRKDTDPEKGIVAKDGFHLHFPHFVCESRVQDEYIRTEAIKRMTDEGTWNDYEFFGTLEHPVVDKYISRKTWLMYGSAKNRTSEPYKCTRCVTYDEDEEGCLKDIPLRDAFADEMELRDAGKTKRKVKYYLPELLSIRGSDPVELNPEVTESLSTFVPKKKRFVKHTRSEDDVLADIQFLKNSGIMDLISDERADDWHDWDYMGRVLYTITEGAPEGLELWIEFSKRSPKFVQGECEDKWEKFNMTKHTIGTIKYFAKLDSPEEYKKFQGGNIKHLVKMSVYNTHKKVTELGLSRVLNAIIDKRFVLANAKEQTWYEFRDHRWNKLDCNAPIRKLMVDELISVYRDFIAEESKNKDAESRGKVNNSISKALEVCERLEGWTLQQSVVKMLDLELNDPKFESTLDENRLLFGVENGVLDLQNCVFRDGLPNDRISMCAGCGYDESLTWSSSEVVDVMDMLKKIFVNDNIRNYWLDVMCSVLEGGNVNKLFCVLTGIGDNAKSLTIRFMEKLFKDYCVKFPQTMFVKGNGNSSGSARPELARVRGKRIAVVQELSKDTSVDIGVLKEVTGNDTLYQRDLFQKGTEAKELNPMFTLFMPCNEPPAIPSNDPATWNRIRVILYESKFIKPHDLHKFPVSDDPDEQYEQKRFKADLTLANRLDNLLPAFLWILFERYKVYKSRGGLTEPKEVLYSTQNLKTKNDHYLRFFEAKIEESDSKKDFIPLKNIFISYKSWFKEEFGENYKDKTSQTSLGTELEKHFRKPIETKSRAKGWYGYRLARGDDIDENGDDHDEEDRVPDNRIIPSKRTKEAARSN